MAMNKLEKEKIKLAEERLGIKFKDKNLLLQSLTHSSYAFEKNENRQVYERLEFLGDSILGFIITDYIYDLFPDYDEGNLALLRSNIVNGIVLAQIAADLGIGDCVFLGKGAELTGSREKVSILGDSFEAIIGAIYLDQGLKKVEGFIFNTFEQIIKEKSDKETLSDFKSMLQEMTMAEFKVLPEYRIFKEEGPVHEKIFYAEVLLNGKILGRGKGASKKKAEQESAKIALERLRG